MALGSGSPELTVLGAPGVDSTCAWVWSDQRGPRDSPEHSGRGIGARSRLAMVRGGSGSTASRVHAVPAPVWLGFWYWEHLHSVAKPHRVLARGYGAAGWVRPWRGGGGGSERREPVGVVYSGRSRPGFRVQKAQQASARYEQAKAGLVRGWAALQRVRHGEPGICAAEHRRALFRPLLRPTGTRTNGTRGRAGAY